jgi:hypothetical protein
LKAAEENPVETTTAAAKNSGNATTATGEFEVCPRLGTCPHSDYEHKLMYCYGDHRRCPHNRS